MISELIKKRRKELGITLKDVAQAVEVTEATIQRYENGTIKSIPAKNIKKLAETLILSPQELLGLEDNNDTNIVVLLQDIKKELQDIRSILEPKKFIPETSSGHVYGNELSTPKTY